MTRKPTGTGRPCTLPGPPSRIVTDEEIGLAMPLSDVHLRPRDPALRWLQSRAAVLNRWVVFTGRAK